VGTRGEGGSSQDFDEVTERGEVVPGVRGGVVPRTLEGGIRGHFSHFQIESDNSIITDLIINLNYRNCL
jgi:hypothetical protein